MASHLSPQQIDEIVDLLDGWPSGTKLTWEALLRLIARRLRVHPTRQTLARHERVRTAYDTRKKALRDPRQPSCDQRVLKQTVRRLTVENDRLRAEIESCRERLARWQYNAYEHGLKKHDLEDPVPRIDRRHTA